MYRNLAEGYRFDISPVAGTAISLWSREKSLLLLSIKRKRISG